MKELTKAEEQVMQLLWKLGEGFVKDLVELFPDPKPAYNTVSTIIRILEKKDFVGHRAYGKTYQYYPLISRKDYTKSFFKNFLNNYFGNSFQQLVSFFSKEENLSLQELEEMMDLMKEHIENKKAKTMDNLLVYLVESSICLVLFYGFYYAFLRNETHFGLIRIYLLSALLVSVVIPLISIQLAPSTETGTLSVLLEPISVGGEISREYSSKVASFSVFNILGKLYITGLIVFFLRFMLQLVKVVLMVFRYDKFTEGRIKIVHTTNGFNNFSFFNYLFINNDNKEADGLDNIIAHESVHIAQMHTVDIIVAELIGIILWFNPFIWLIKKSIKETHEYLADAGVIEQGFSQAKYQLLLLDQVVGKHLGLANNFNKSLTIKRLSMMKKLKSTNLSKVKFLLAIPIVAIMFITFSCSEETTINDEQKNELKSAVAKEEVTTVDGKKVYFSVDEMPEYPGGMLALRKFIATNVKYPTKARESKTQGKIFVKFVVTKTGEVANVEIAGTRIPEYQVDGVTVVGYKKVENPELLPDLSFLEKEAVRVVQSMDSWIPGKKDGNEVNVYFTIPINFQLQ